MGKKIKFMMMIFMMSLFLLNAYDEEDDVNRATGIGYLENNILDFYVGSPADTTAPEFKLRIGALLHDKFRLGVTASMFNVLDKFEEYSTTEYQSDLFGNPEYINRSKELNRFNWAHIDNSLGVYLGYRHTDALYFGFSVKGGSDVSQYAKTAKSSDFKYNPDGTLNSTIPGTDDVFTTSETFKGKGFVNAGFGAVLLKDFFPVEWIDSVSIREDFNFQFGADGDAGGFLRLGETGVQSALFDGNGGTYSAEKKYYQNGTDLIESYNVKHKELFDFFAFTNSGLIETGIDLHTVIPGLRGLSRMRFTPGAGYSIGIISYLSSSDATDYTFNHDIFGYATNDYRKTKTEYTPDMFIRSSLVIPLTIDIRPIREVQAKIGYTFNFASENNSYKARYSEERTVHGVNNSFTDPVVSYTSTAFNFSHQINARFRYEFPKVVRLSAGAVYSIEHSLIANTYSISNNIRTYTDGTTGKANYDTIANIKNFSENTYPFTVPMNTGVLKQSINPYLELDFEVVKDFATITVGWEPLIAWTQSGNDILSDTNLLNLANWKVTNVIKFDSIKADAINYTGVTQRKDTYDELVILHTNDTHGHPLAFDMYPSTGIGGLPARATLVKDMRKNHKNVLVLDAGDYNTGMPESNFFNAQPDITGMNYIGYDAVTIGNHEFDVRFADLEKQMKNAGFPFLAANVKNANGSLIAKPYIIKQFNGFKVAILGLLTKDTAFIGSKATIEGIVFEDEVETARRLVPELRKQADIVIVLGHLGLYDSDVDNGSRRLAREVEGIDLIIDGHTHSKMYQPEYENNVPIVQAWKWGMIVGKASFVIKDKKPVSFSWEPLPVNMTDVQIADNGISKTRQIGSAYKEDRGLLIKLRPYMEKVQKILGEVIGVAGGEFSAVMVRKAETAIGNLVADSMMWFAEEQKPDFAFQNSGGIRSDIPSGSVTKKTIYEVLPFDNTVMVVSLRGSDILKMFSYIASITPGDGAFPQVSKEVSFSINYQTKQCENILINGEKVNSEKIYKVVTNSYIAEGGNNYTMFLNAVDLYDTSAYQRDVLIEYFKKFKNIIPKTDNRIIKVINKISIIKTESSAA